jgi:hypothetical protein
MGVRVLDVRQLNAASGGVPNVVQKQVWQDVPGVAKSDAAVRLVMVIR